MLDFYLSTITDAATAAGIATVRLNPKNPTSAALPLPRVDVAWGTERVTPDKGKLTSFPTPGSESTHRTVRRRRFRVEQPVTVTVWSKDKAALPGMADELLMALPRTVADPGGNRVAVKAERAVWGGFSSDVVDVMKKYSKALTIIFTALRTRDESGRWILDVDNDVTHGGQDNG